MIDSNRKKTLTVISLGAGVQSSTMALMSAKGVLPKVDCAVFADTMYENSSSYKYLKYLESILPFPIYKISKDEITRMKPSWYPYILNRHPLIEANMSRQDCINWMNKNNFIIPEKSACICCPFHDDKYWKNLKIKYPTEFADAVALDKEIRTISRNKNIKNYTHRSCKPLDEVDFDPDKNQLDMFENECEGVCMI